MKLGWCWDTEYKTPVVSKTSQSNSEDDDDDEDSEVSI